MNVISRDNNRQLCIQWKESFDLLLCKSSNDVDAEDLYNGIAVFRAFLSDCLQKQNIRGEGSASSLLRILGAKDLLEHFKFSPYYTVQEQHSILNIESQGNLLQVPIEQESLSQSHFMPFSSLPPYDDTVVDVVRGKSLKDSFHAFISESFIFWQQLLNASCLADFSQWYMKLNKLLEKHFPEYYFLVDIVNALEKSGQYHKVTYLNQGGLSYLLSAYCRDKNTWVVFKVPKLSRKTSQQDYYDALERHRAETEFLRNYCYGEERQRYFIESYGSDDSFTVESLKVPLIKLKQYFGPERIFAGKKISQVVTLREVISIFSQIDPLLSVWFCANLSEVMWWMHQSGCLYRDLKPDNIFLGKEFWQVLQALKNNQTLSQGLLSYLLHEQLKILFLAHQKDRQILLTDLASVASMNSQAKVFKPALESNGKPSLLRTKRYANETALVVNSRSDDAYLHHSDRIGLAAILFEMITGKFARENKHLIKEDIRQFYGESKIANKSLKIVRDIYCDPQENEKHSRLDHESRKTEKLKKQLDALVALGLLELKEQLTWTNWLRWKFFNIKK